MKNTIAVDLDNVVAETDGTIREIIALLSGVKLNREDIVTFDYHQALLAKGIPSQDALIIESTALDRFHSSECLSLPVMPGASDALRELHTLGNVVGIVTGRPSYAEQVTVRWLKERGIPYAWLKHAADKAEVSCGWNLFIDDAPHHALAVAAKGITVYLMDHPWNRYVQATPGITRVSGWKEAFDLYVKM